MKKEVVKLLKQQSDKIDNKDFDLESWKKYTSLLLRRIFSNDDEKVKQIELLEYEYNSWALRDASGNESYEEGTKKLAREIIQVSIDEISTFGLPTEKQGVKVNSEKLISIINDELKGSQLKLLKAVIDSEETDEEKRRQVFEIVETLGEKAAYEMITNIIIHIEDQ